MASQNVEEPTFYHMYDNRVRLAETDAQAVVFYGSYVTYMDEASLQYFREIGFPYEDIVGGDWETVVVHADLDFHASAGFGDILSNEVRVSTIGTSSLTFDYRCLRDDEVIATGSLVLVAIDGDGEPIPVPSDLREAIVEYQNVPPAES